MCPLDRAPVSPSEQHQPTDKVMKNYGCTATTVSKEEVRNEQSEDDSDCPSSSPALGTLSNLTDEPNTMSLGAPIHSAGEEVSPFVREIEELL